MMTYRAVALLLSTIVVMTIGCSDERSSQSDPEVVAEKSRPNILIIMADDMGYSDPGYMGSEISTPNLDALAATGVIMTDFHVTPVCNTTRAQLLTGADHNLATTGERAFVRLTDDALPVSKVLQDAGYNTFFSGKWDVGRMPEYYPPKKGFTESFALLIGGASHFSDNTRIMAPDPDPGVYVEGLSRLESLPDDFYSSTYYTDRIIHYIDKYRESEKPFFAYLAPTAPHWPLQAPAEYIDRYDGLYDAGYESIRQERYAALRSMNLNTHDLELPSMREEFPDWDELSPLQRKLEAKRMQIYAGMLEKLDAEIGRLIDYLDSIGELDDTFIVFLSDNGADGFSSYDFPGNPELIEELYDLSFENMGRARSYETVGPGWAQVQTLTRSLWKYFPSEGGTRSPAVFAFPAQLEPGASDAYATLRDLTATIVDAAGLTPQDGTYGGKAVLPIDGVSLLPHLRGEMEQVHDDTFVAGHYYAGLGGVRKGQWKLTRIPEPYGSGEWQLFNLFADPYEQNDLSESHTKELSAMLQAWDEYRNRVGLPELVEFHGKGIKPISHYDLHELLPGYGE